MNLLLAETEYSETFL